MRHFVSALIVVLGYFPQVSALQQGLEIQGESLLSQEKLQIKLSTQKKGAVLVFLSARCPCSNSHTAELKQLSQDYPEFQFVAVHSNTEESIEESKKYFSEQKFSFPIIEDHKQVLAEEYKALKTPHAFVVLSSGQLVYKGGVSSSRTFDQADRKYLREALEDLKNNRPVKVAEARTLGCAITRAGENTWR